MWSVCLSILQICCYVCYLIQIPNLVLNCFVFKALKGNLWINWNTLFFNFHICSYVSHFIDKLSIILSWMVCFLSFIIEILASKDNLHRCTHVENPGDGVTQIFAKSLRGQGFPEKIALGVPYFGFCCIFMYKSFEIFLWGPSPLTLPPTPSSLFASITICELIEFI